jgi:hypothetical protein
VQQAEAVPAQQAEAVLARETGALERSVVGQEQQPDLAEGPELSAKLARQAVRVPWAETGRRGRAAVGMRARLGLRGPLSAEHTSARRAEAGIGWSAQPVSAFRPVPEAGSAMAPPGREQPGRLPS